MSIQIQNALGILSSEVPTGNLLWVDAVNGVDKLARRGRMTIPFRTLNAARDAAQMDDTIVVLPGSYHETDLARHRVNWHFCNGAVVDYGGSSTLGIFYPSGGECSYRVTGYGVFKMSNGATLITGGASEDQIYVECARLEADGVVLDAAATMLVRCEAMVSHGANCVLATLGGASTDKVAVFADEMRSVGSAILTELGILDVFAGRIVSTADNGVTFKGGEVNITASDIISATDYALECNASSGFCRIHNARLVSEASAKPAAFITAGSGKLGLKHCCLVGGASATYSIDAANANTNVVAYGLGAGNKDKGPNVKFGPVAWIYDSGFV